jgi:hypothetical protein
MAEKATMVYCWLGITTNLPNTLRGILTLLRKSKENSDIRMFSGKVKVAARKPRCWQLGLQSCHQSLLKVKNNLSGTQRMMTHTSHFIFNMLQDLSVLADGLSIHQTKNQRSDKALV